MRASLALVLVLLVCGCSGGTRTSHRSTSAGDAGTSEAPPPKPGVIVYSYHDREAMRGPGPVDPMAAAEAPKPTHPVGGMYNDSLLEVVITWNAGATLSDRQQVLERYGMLPQGSAYGTMVRYLVPNADPRRLHGRLIAEDLIEAVAVHRPQVAVER